MIKHYLVLAALIADAIVASVFFFKPSLIVPGMTCSIVVYALIMIFALQQYVAATIHLQGYVVPSRDDARMDDSCLLCLDRLDGHEHDGGKGAMAKCTVCGCILHGRCLMDLVEANRHQQQRIRCPVCRTVKTV